MRSVALLLLLGCTKVLAHCEAGVSCKWGSFNGKWTVTDSTWTPDEGKVTNSCVSICLDDDKTVGPFLMAFYVFAYCSLDFLAALSYFIQFILDRGQINCRCVQFTGCVLS